MEEGPEAVLLELLADEQMAGCQHFAFKEYGNAREDRILSGHAKGSIISHMAQMKMRPRKVPYLIVLYITPPSLSSAFLSC